MLRLVEAVQDLLRQDCDGLELVFPSYRYTGRQNVCSDGLSLRDHLSASDMIEKKLTKRCWGRRAASFAVLN